MKNPRWANKKPKVKFLCNWQQFHEKINVVPQKKLFRKKCLLSTKISDDFLVNSSDFSNFHPVFVKTTESRY